MIYMLLSEDPSRFGDPIAGECIKENWRGFYSGYKEAMGVAERDHGRPIPWMQIDKAWFSGNLGYVIYTIRPL